MQTWPVGSLELWPFTVLMTWDNIIPAIQVIYIYIYTYIYMYTAYFWSFLSQLYTGGFKYIIVLPCIAMYCHTDQFSLL